MDMRSAAFRAAGIGWYIAICLALGILGGRWLDRRYQTDPVLTLVGITAGLALALYGVYRLLYQIIKEDEKKGKGDT